MNVSLNWLKEYITLDLEVDKISEILTAIGLEVEGQNEIQSIKGGLLGLVVGHVEECIQHPNADKLKLTKVNVGAEDLLQIVCGAPNVAAGQKVIVATIGTVLYPQEGDSFKIKKGKIRGEVSEGMICALDEIGLGSDHSGIIVLEDDVAIGLPASEYYNVENDIVFDIGLTPNRSDATSHFGVAADLGAYLKIHHDNNIQLKKPEVSAFHVSNTSKSFRVELKNEDACPRYSGICISNVQIKESPTWLKNRLNAIGVKSINNVVDITNFILHELGQPLHAFDADKIPSNQIVVGNLPQGTKFVTLDEKERELSDQDLMICDGDMNPLCIGGVFGGIHSGVTDSTVNIFLEAAHFNAKSIRNTSTSHLLRTDAAKVFEKGSDPNITLYALKRAALLLVDLADGVISSEIIDVYPKPILEKEIELRYSKVNELLGTEVEKSDVHDILRALNMEILPVDDESIKVKVPTNKSDVVREVDLIEEILRIYGFNNIKLSPNITYALTYTDGFSKKGLIERMSQYLASNNFNEIMGLSLIESKYYPEVVNVQEDSLVYINNTSNIHLNIMRPEPLLSGLISVLHNQNYNNQNLRLFENGRTYKKSEDAFEEKEFFTIYVKGLSAEESWSNAKQKLGYTIYNMKAICEQLLALNGIHHFKANNVEDERFDYGSTLSLANTSLVKMGAVSEDVLDQMGIKSPVFYAEFDVEAVLNLARKQKLTTQSIGNFPSMRRDLALVIDEEVDYGRIVELIYKVDKKLIKEVGLFDIYRNEEHLGKGKKSYAIKMIFQSKDKTLKDKEVDKIVKKLIHSFETNINAVIRK